VPIETKEAIRVDRRALGWGHLKKNKPRPIEETQANLIDGIYNYIDMQAQVPQPMPFQYQQ